MLVEVAKEYFIRININIFVGNILYQNLGHGKKRKKIKPWLLNNKNIQRIRVLDAGRPVLEWKCAFLCFFEELLGKQRLYFSSLAAQT